MLIGYIVIERYNKPSLSQTYGTAIGNRNKQTLLSSCFLYFLLCGFVPVKLILLKVLGNLERINFCKGNATYIRLALISLG